MNVNYGEEQQTRKFMSNFHNKRAPYEEDGLQEFVKQNLPSWFHEKGSLFSTFIWTYIYLTSRVAAYNRKKPLVFAKAWSRMEA